MNKRQKQTILSLVILLCLLSWCIGLAMARLALKTDEKGNWFSLVEVTQGEGPCVKLRPLGRGEKVVALPIQDANDIKLMYPKYRVIAQFPGDFMPRIVELPTTLMFSENEDLVGKHNGVIVMYWKGKS